ncbi:hypothetical protein LNTAR_11956 [Lentisphaera araneosa HTCC2155]|uniref:Uncharacterized protein n=1 Tax=Lentisphaera araneosa HTCC2155 TaxID=313628 RepID=A6DJJ2_9BACT|nr:hypothetical protein [Lentisphaera araneosa]EDM28066.1 hypothetical protein LNTAR_11956 [Lentisphaera araneosa HTCC2155]
MRSIKNIGFLAAASLLCAFANLSSSKWVRKSIDFTTGSKSKQATIYLKKSLTGKGFAWGDNFTLPLTPQVR